MQLGIRPRRLYVTPLAFKSLLEAQLRQAFVGWKDSYVLILASGRFRIIHKVVKLSKQ